MLGEVFDAFLKESPVSVLFRATLERALAPARLDDLFARAAERQRSGELLFSACVELMAMVVSRTRRSVHAAYRSDADRFGVSVRSLYSKLAGIEPRVTEELVASTAADLGAVMQSLKAAPHATPLEGYEVRVLDGNYLSGTDHRLTELRTLGAAALPGMTLCVYDPQRNLVRGLIACEDGHANERRLIDQVLPGVEAGQCWLADRNFSVHAFLFGVAGRDACFVVRQHTQLVGEPVGRRRKVGRVEGGTLYEQGLRVKEKSGQTLTLRRLTIRLDEPTRFDEDELHLLTNLPEGVDAKRVAESYRGRWTIEAAFMHLATALRSEVNTLGYPDAALFAFGIGLLLYNVLALIEAAIETSQPRRANKTRRLSPYYIAEEVSSVYRGMMIAVPPECWREAFAALSNDRFAKQLLCIAKKVNTAALLTNPRTPKKPPPKRKSGGRGGHVSTHKLLAERNTS